ncbi:Uncharacterized protein FWK35_00017167 [Aphis craccivora]|uniref:Uncharacterized protein n=1 Tax=Aphis craccivora TaxID=307492 RepID=A0A6G0Y797_APHCR|nr:Uncharacterized protein FWK35_00017167 [Aphis craccivora]
MPGSGEKRGFVIEAFFKNSEYVIATSGVFTGGGYCISPGHFFTTEVFKHRLRTIKELKETIRQEISAIPLDMLPRVMENFESRSICTSLINAIT